MTDKADTGSDRLGAARAAAVAATITRVREIERSQGISHESLRHVQGLLCDLAARAELFDCARFPVPVEQPNLNYLLSEDDDHRFALYLSTGRPGRGTPPHDHTTWAVIVGLDGVEENRLYERLDDRSVPGRADVRESGRQLVGSGEGIAFMPDDIHSVHVVGDAPTRHFHLYGMSLEHLPGRQQYDLENGTCKVFPASPGIVKC